MSIRTAVSEVSTPQHSAISVSRLFYIKCNNCAIIKSPHKCVWVCFTFHLVLSGPSGQSHVQVYRGPFLQLPIGGCGHFL